MIKKINLSGKWGFRSDEEKSGIEKEYFIQQGNDKINLPSTTSLSGKGRVNSSAATGYLTEAYSYEGYAWFYKTVNLCGAAYEKKVEFIMERTRVTSLWINGQYAGTCNSLCTPHVYDITKYICGDEINIAVMVNNTDYPTKGGHLTSPDTQSNWNGITGEIALIVSEKKSISRITAYPQQEKKSVRLKFELEGTSEADISVWGASNDSRVIDKKSFHIINNEEYELYLGDDASVWSEHNPIIYTLSAAIDGSSDITQIVFGLRSFTAEGMDFCINGIKTQLRGKHDGMIFPLTGAAPTTFEEWYRVMSISKSWGINHYRFHTCCPPEAAFAAADALGIYMQPELPFWGTITDENDGQHNEVEQQYLIEEGRKILRTFGNHPSFVMMSLGNELWGSSEKMSEILREYHTLDNRHLYTQGSNNFQFWPKILDEDDFFSGVRLSKERLIRGSYAMCDAPLGFVQTEEPNTVYSYDKMIFPDSKIDKSNDNCNEIEIQYGTGVKKVKVDEAESGLIPTKPIISHEVGQYAVYPNFNEISKYTGVLKARNFEIFRERLNEKGLLDFADKFFKSSGKLSAQCYKLEIEAAMRSKYIAGFQLLDLQDFSGQGTALVGMLDAFMDSKNLIKREIWNGFCSDAVILAEIEKFVVESESKFKANIYFRYSGEADLIGKKVSWKVVSEEKIIEYGDFLIPDKINGIEQIGNINFSIPKITDPKKITIELVAEQIRPENPFLSQNTSNSYTLWAYPMHSENFALYGKSEYNDTTVYVTEKLDEAKKLLRDGERVVYFSNEPYESIKGFYCTDFWCYPMFRSISESMKKEVPVGTMGLLINNTHPALKKFTCEDYSTPQWYNIVSHSNCAILDNAPLGYSPIVRMIDNFERNHNLGILYEAQVLNGKLLVCTSKISEISQFPEVQSFVKSILDYAHSEQFSPSQKLTFSQLCLEK